MGDSSVLDDSCLTYIRMSTKDHAVTIIIGGKCTISTNIDVTHTHNIGIVYSELLFQLHVRYV